MVRLADWPIRRKLGFLTASGALIALLLACLAFGIHGVQMIRAAKVQQITALANTLGSNATTALEFSDADVAAEVLSSLRLQPSIELAVLYDGEGTLATYPAELPSGEAVPSEPRSMDALFSDNGHLVITQDIYRNGDRVGAIYLRSNLKEINRQLVRTVGIILSVMVVALGIAMVMTGRLQRVFTAPIQELASAMERIAAGGDYSLRVTKHGRDELGVLCDGFNTMLDQVRLARDELQHAHDELENRVVQRTAQLQVALEAAESASRAKSDFLANMSHEIRTPMTAILGYADILAEEDNLSKSDHEHVATIRRNGKHLLRIINDILDLSKIEAGKMTVERIECSPCQIVADVTSLMRPRTVEKGLVLDVAYRGPIPERIRTDPTRLHQILGNLIGNAIKFTGQGSVHLAISMADPAGDENPRLCFEITDSGVGMSPGQLGDVFKAFTQADESMSRRFGGTGLGLTISKALVEMLGGTLSVESELGTGSTFRFTVATGPLDQVHMSENCREAEAFAPGEPIRDKPYPAVRLSGRVLLCEDGPDNQRLIVHLLKKAGADVTIAENGQIGLDKAARAEEAGQPFDVILMDMQMPVLDGYSATRRLRQQGYPGPIIALTAHAMAEDRQKCLDAGCNDYASKPIDRARLMATIARHMAGAQEEADAARTASKAQ